MPFASPTVGCSAPEAVRPATCGQGLPARPRTGTLTAELGVIRCQRQRDALFCQGQPVGVVFLQSTQEHVDLREERNGVLLLQLLYAGLDVFQTAKLLKSLPPFKVVQERAEA